ncbi:MAG: acyl carrier protein [Paludibacteraceae bacterium]|nr:acyl carrier protein [Paludibacteraceae bacterium]
MEKAELIEKINAVLVEEFEVEPETITPDADIKRTLKLDSLSLVDMVALIESEFKVKIQNSQIASLKTFSLLYDFIYDNIEK